MSSRPTWSPGQAPKLQRHLLKNQTTTSIKSWVRNGWETFPEKGGFRIGHLNSRVRETDTSKGSQKLVTVVDTDLEVLREGA